MQGNKHEQLLIKDDMFQVGVLKMSPWVVILYIHFLVYLEMFDSLPKMDMDLMFP